MTLYRPTVSIVLDAGATTVPDSVVLEGITITHGRPDAWSDPEPATASIVFLASSAPADLFVLGSSVWINASISTPLPGIDVSLFRGRITDVTLDRTFLSIVAVSEALGQAAQSTGTVTFTTKNARDAYVDVAGAALGAGAIPAYDYVGTSPVSVRGQTFTDGTWLEYLRRIARSDPAGVLQEDPRTETVVFACGNSRRDVAPSSALTINAGAIADSWQASRSIADRVNRAVVSYGSAGATVAYQSTSDIAAFGLYERTLDTVLASDVDAELLARRTVTFGTDPGWRLPTLEVDVLRWDAGSAARSWFADGRVGSLVHLPTLPSALVPSYLFVEGWTYRIGRETWRLSLNVSDPTLSRLPQRWSDISAGLMPARRWNQVPAGWTWTDSIRKDL